MMLFVKKKKNVYVEKLHLIDGSRVRRTIEFLYLQSQPPVEFDPEFKSHLGKHSDFKSPTIETHFNF